MLVTQSRSEGGQPDRCPRCDASWPDALAKPYRLQTCPVCKDAKRQRQELAGSAFMRRKGIERQEAARLFAALSPEERRAAADKAYQELFGP